jgi:hypothetical protein
MFLTVLMVPCLEELFSPSIVSVRLRDEMFCKAKCWCEWNLGLGGVAEDGAFWSL